jgi:glycosyltransferase involved in cell wall biosynthesis
MEISVVIPVHNERGNIINLDSEIRIVFSQLKIDWECIWVDDASTDGTWDEILKLEIPNKGIKLRTKSGQTTAIMAGIDTSKYNFIVTLDGDNQNDPLDISRMVQLMLGNPELDLIQGYREKRMDHEISRKLLSKFANILVRKLSGKKILDLGCSIRLFKKDLMNNLRLTGEMHRLLTLYLIDCGAQMTQISVNHRPRINGNSKYGPGRILKLSVDIILYKAMKAIFVSPLYTFAKFSLIGFVTSISIMVGATLFKIFGAETYITGTLVSTSIILFGTSTIFIGLGLIAEMVTRILITSSSGYQYTLISKHN